MAISTKQAKTLFAQAKAQGKDLTPAPQKAKLDAKGILSALARLEELNFLKEANSGEGRKLRKALRDSGHKGGIGKERREKLASLRAKCASEEERADLQQAQTGEMERVEADFKALPE